MHLIRLWRHVAIRVIETEKTCNVPKQTISFIFEIPVCNLKKTSYLEVEFYFQNGIFKFFL